LKTSSDLIRNSTPDLLACSALPQQTTLLHAPEYQILVVRKKGQLHLDKMMEDSELNWIVKFMKSTTVFCSLLVFRGSLEECTTSILKVEE
jgi:hypothetical protein